MNGAIRAPGAESALLAAAARYAVRGLYAESGEALSPIIGKDAPAPLIAAAEEMRAQAPEKAGLRRLGDAMAVRTPTKAGPALIWVTEGPLASGHEQIESFSRLAQIVGGDAPAAPKGPDSRALAAEAVGETPGAGKRRWLKQAAAAIGARTGWANVAILEIAKGKLRRVHAANRDIGDRRADFAAFIGEMTDEERFLQSGEVETPAAAFYREMHALDGFALYAPKDGYGIYIEPRAEEADLTFVADLIGRRRKPAGDGTSRIWRKAALALIVTAAVVYAAMPSPMLIGAPAELRPAVSELQVALHEARLVEINVQVGDRVEVGDVLATLSSPQLETAEEQAALDVILEQMNARQALGEDDFAAYELAEQRGEILELRAAQSRRRLDELTIRAAVAGRIADVVDRAEIGAVLSTGAVIAEIQKTGEMNALLTLDAADGALLTKGMAGEVVLRGVVDRTYPVTLIEDPVLMQQADGAEALTALAEIHGETNDDLYKGLSGFAQITGESGPRALNYLRPLLEYVELTIWKYTGWRL